MLAGRPTLTVLDGSSRALEPGEVVACPAGREGAHRLDNHGDEPARVLIVSTMRAPEINEMLEDGTLLGARLRTRADPAGAGPRRARAAPARPRALIRRSIMAVM